ASANARAPRRMWPRAEAGSTKFGTCPEKTDVRRGTAPRVCGFARDRTPGANEHVTLGGVAHRSMTDVIVGNSAWLRGAWRDSERPPKKPGPAACAMLGGWRGCWLVRFAGRCLPARRR